MLLCLDLGNTRAKWGLYECQGLRPTQHLHGAIDTQSVQSNAQIASWLDGVSAQCESASLGRPEGLAVSSVRGADSIAFIKAWAQANHVALYTTKARAQGASASRQLCTLYDNPASLGQDRWAASLAVAGLTAFGVNLVVSLGTATTLDAVVSGHLLEDVSSEFVHLGGYILPGIHTMLASLNQQTAQLPLVSPRLSHWPVNTEDAIGSGVLNAQLGAVQGCIHSLKERFGVAPHLWLTGGSVPALRESLVGLAVTELPDAVLQGLCFEFKASQGGPT